MVGAGRGPVDEAATQYVAETIVETASGRLRGIARNGIHSFRGVHYGASTAGRNRFRAPQPVQPWAGVRDALAFGPTCPQQPIRYELPMFAWYHPELHDSEDCLTLNVYTPGVRDGDIRRRPVMVWLHGGGFSVGGSTAEVFDGANLARHGDVVVVTVTHRLNLFGFMYLADRGEAFRDSGNAGMLDVVAALQWVRDNITQFGGDPGNVTLFGQSGGTGKVSTILAMPAAKGLIHKAILQSGCALTLRTTEQAARHAAQVLSHLPWDGKDPDALYDMPVGQLLAASRAGGPNFGPAVDGVTLPRHPFDPDAPEVSAHVPVIIGSTAQEATYSYRKGAGLDALRLNHPDDMAEVRERLVHKLRCDGPAADRLLAVYRSSHPGMTPSQLMIAVESDYLYRLKCTQFAERKAAQGRAPVYMYHLAWQTRGMGGLFGATHTMCPPLSFRNPHVAEELLGTGPEVQALSDRISTAWVAFARTGDPNSARTGDPNTAHAGNRQHGEHESPLPQWQPYTLPERPTLVFDNVCRVVNDLFAEDRLAIAAHGPHANYIESVKRKFTKQVA
jgi:para-nitrobenzyl esterase